jgi:RNA polymerase sigma-70 factor (ECF subfamily)
MEADTDLVYRALKGDSDAFGLLVRMYREEVYAIALSIAGDPTDAEDLAQEAFIKAYLNLSQLKHPERFGAWLRRIARNHCKDWLRTHAEQYLPIDDLFSQEQFTFPPADDRILSEDFGRMLASALSALKKEDEQILRLFYMCGFKYDEITRVNGISYSAAASRLHKAKKRIKALIDGHISPSEARSAMTALSGGVEYMKLGLSTDILDGIRAVEYAQSAEIEKRQFFCGVNLEYTQEHGLRLIATDGKRMAVAQLPGDGGEEDISMTIPTEELGILKEAMEGKPAAVSVEQIDEDMAAFYIDDTKKLVKLISAKFPDYKAVIFYPRSYTESITIERKPAIDSVEKIIEESEGNCPSDWIQRGDVVYVSHASDILETREITNRSMELCYTFLGFITKSASPQELADSILNHLSQEEYQKWLDKLEKRRVPPAEPVGKLKILASEGEAEFAGRLNSHFLLDAFGAMVGDTVKIRYRMGSHMNVTMRAVLLEDDTDNVHVVMPMKVE